MKPNWNYVIPNAEAQVNKAVKDQNNPDPTMCIDVSTAQMGIYAPGNY